MIDGSLQRHPSLNEGISAAELNAEFQQELVAIGDWWITHAIDREQGGFYGEIRPDNSPIRSATKGIVLNTRILWFFSEVAAAIDKPEYRTAAERAYGDRKSTRLNSSHVKISYAVFCLKKKRKTQRLQYTTIRDSTP